MVELAMYCKLDSIVHLSFVNVLLLLIMKFCSQQPGGQMPAVRPRRNDRTNGAGGTQVRGGASGSSDDSGRNRRYRPY